MICDPASVNLDLESAPAGWPSWTDADAWELGPDPADEAWWAEHAPGNGDDFDLVEDLDEAAALESAALDAIEMGLIPRDLAEGIARTSLVGLADEMTTSYADEEERLTGARPSNEVAARNLAIASFRMGHMA